MENGENEAKNERGSMNTKENDYRGMKWGKGREREKKERTKNKRLEKRWDKAINERERERD